MRKDHECPLSCGCRPSIGGQAHRHPRTRHAATKHAAGPTGFTHGNCMDRHNSLIGSFLRAYPRPIAKFARCLLHPNKKYGNGLQRLKKKEPRMSFSSVSAVNERFIVIRERVLTLSPQLLRVTSATSCEDSVRIRRGRPRGNCGHIQKKKKNHLHSQYVDNENELQITD